MTQVACNGRFSSSLWSQSHTFFRVEVGRCGPIAVARWSSPGADWWEHLTVDVRLRRHGNGTWFGVMLVGALEKHVGTREDPE